MFHVIKRKIDDEVKERNTTHQTWEQFVDAVKHNVWSIPTEYIEKTISSIRQNDQKKYAKKIRPRRTKY